MKILSALLIGALALAVPAAAQVFTAGPGLALAIPDGTYNGTIASMACSTIVVPSGGGGGNSVDNVTVQIAQSHTFVGDLTIKLTGPTGVVTTLVSRPGVLESADDGNDTVGFGENSNLLIANPLTYEQVATNESEQMGKVPSDLATGDTICLFAGSPCNYNPDNGAATSSEDLSTAYDGTSKVGNWQLCIGDGAATDTGTLDGWTLTITSVPVSLQSFTVGD